MREPPAILQWVIRRLHNGVNRWTQRRIIGLDGRYGWSAWSHVMAGRGYRPAARMEALVDWLFWPGHCAEDFERIQAGRPLDTGDWRLVWATARVLALPALAILAAVLAA